MTPARNRRPRSVAIGVLIDDLVTKGTDSEPYRMFTSRAEHRLLLREDNAALRLTERGRKIGLASDQSYSRLREKLANITRLMTLLQDTQLNPSSEINSKLKEMGSTNLRNCTTLVQLLRRPEIGIRQIADLAPEVSSFRSDVCVQAEVQIKYSGYIERQEEIVKRFRKLEDVRVPGNLDYAEIKGLSREVREKLTNIKPTSLGQASRIVGITPAAVSTLAIYLRKKGRNGQNESSV